MIDHDIHPKKKDKDWVAGVIKKYWSDFTVNNTNSFYNRRAEYADIRSYMNGTQDTSIYKKILIPDDQAEDDFSYLNINWDVLPVVSKFYRMIVQIVKNLRYSPGVHAIDNLAIDDQDRYYADKAAEILLRNQLIESLEQAGVDIETVMPLDKTSPQDFDELDMEMEFSYKDNTAKAFEIIISDIFEKNRYDEDRDRLIQDLVAIGAAVEQDYVDYDGEIRTRYVDPDSFVAPFSNEPDFGDAEYMGEVRMMTLSEIMNNSSEDDLAKAEFKELEDCLEDKGSSRFSSNMEGDKFRVLYMEFKSTNSQTYEVRKREDGSYRYGRKTGGSKNKEVFNGYFDVIYCGFWVIDSAYTFGCGLQTNIKRPEDSLKECSFTYSVYAPYMRNGQLYSLGAAMKPLGDQIQLAYLKTQNAIVKARPKGIAISADALQGVMLGPDEITPQQNIDLYNYTGSMVLRFVDEEGSPLVQPPIKELVNGLGNEANEYFNVIVNNINLIREITGLNEIMDGSSPDPKMLKSVAQMASLSSSNSIRYIHEAEKKLTDRVGTALMDRIMDAAMDGTLKVYAKAVGSNAIRTIELGKEAYGRKLALYFEEEPRQDELEELNAYIQAALKPATENGFGQITIDDAVFIKNIRNIRKAWQFLAYRVKKNKEQMERAARRRAAENAKFQEQAAMLAEQEKRKTMEMEANLKMKLIQTEKMFDMKIEQMKLSGRLSEEKERTSARIQQTSISADSKEQIESKRLAVFPKSEQSTKQ